MSHYCCFLALLSMVALAASQHLDNPSISPNVVVSVSPTNSNIVYFVAPYCYVSHSVIKSEKTPGKYKSKSGLDLGVVQIGSTTTHVSEGRVQVDELFHEICGNTVLAFDCATATYYQAPMGDYLADLVM